MLDFDVRDFGAVGDNTGDDHPGIQAAIDAATSTLEHPIGWPPPQPPPSSAGAQFSLPGATVRLPPGRYLLGDPLLLPGGQKGSSQSGRNVHLVGHPGATVLRAGPGFPERRGLIEWTIGPPPASAAAELLCWIQGRVDALARTLPVPLEGTPLDPHPHPLPPGPVALPPPDPSRSPVWNGVQELVALFSAWLEESLRFLDWNSQTRLQRIAGLRLYPSEHGNTYLINRRWPLLVAVPDALIVLRRWLAGGPPELAPAETAQALADTRYVFDFCRGALNAPHPDSGVLISVGRLIEASRVELQLEDILASSKDDHHTASFRFDGCVHRSRFRNITVDASPNLPTATRRLPLFLESSEPALHYTETDTVTFLFEHRTPRGWPSQDACGFQYGEISNVIVANRQGGHNCFVRGRLHSSTVRNVFLNRALFGASLHLIRACDSRFEHVHSEGATAHPEVLLDGCIGLRFDGFGLGHAAPAGWPTEPARSAGQRLSGAMVLRDTHDCEFSGRILFQDQPDRLASLAVTPGSGTVASPQFPPCLIRVEADCRRNRFRQVFLVIGQDFSSALAKVWTSGGTGAVREEFARLLRAEFVILNPTGEPGWNTIEGQVLVPDRLRTGMGLAALGSWTVAPAAVPFRLGREPEPVQVDEVPLVWWV